MVVDHMPIAVLADIWVISGRYLGDIWLFSRELDHMATAAGGALPHQAVARSSPNGRDICNPPPRFNLTGTPKLMQNATTKTIFKIKTESLFANK